MGYILTITLHGKIVLRIECPRYSGDAMMELARSYRKDFPPSQGYEIDW